MLKRKEVNQSTNQNIQLSKDGTHYIIEDTPYRRVTDFLSERLFKPFDSLSTAINFKRKNNSNNTPSLNVNDQMHYWSLNGKRAAAYGTAVHLFAEMYILDPTTKPINNRERAVVKFLTDHKLKYKVLTTELKVWSPAHKLAGTIDCILQDLQTQELLILDWKTSEDLTKSYNKCINELKAYPQSKQTIYSAQLTTYRELARLGTTERGKLNISSCIIVELSTTGTYTIHNITNLTSEITTVLNSIVDYEILITQQ